MVAPSNFYETCLCSRKLVVLFTSRRTPYLLTFAILAVSVGSYTLMQSMTVPVMTEIAHKMDTTQSTVTWVLTAYLLSASVFTPIAGRMGDAYGKKRMLVVSLVALSLGSLIAALAPNIGVLILARVVQGVGGGVMPLAFGIIRDEFPAAKVGNAVAIVSSLTAVGFGVGVVLAGPIVDGLGYHWLFWSPFIVTSLTTVAAILVVPESPVRTPGRIAFLPALLLSSWLVCLLLGLSQAPEWGWLSPGVIALLVMAVVLAAVWIKVELTIDVPLIDMKMMRLPGVWTTNLVGLLVGVGMYASLGFIPQFNQTPADNGYGFGASISVSGLMTLPSAVASFVAGIAAASIARRIGAKAVVVAGSLIGASGMAMLAFWHQERWHVVMANSLTGFSTGLAFACLAGLIVAAVPPEQTSSASGMNANIRTIGGSIGTAVMASIVTSTYLPSGFPQESGYTAGFTVLAVMMLFAAVAAMLIPRAPRPEPVRRAEDDELAVGGVVPAVA